MSDGFLFVNDTKEDNLILFPAQHVGSICLSMIVSDDFSTRNIRADSANVEAEGEFELETAWDSQGNPKRVQQNI